MYLLKPYRSKWMIVAPRLHVGFMRKLREKGTIAGIFREVEQVGYDRRKLDVVAQDGTTGGGHEASRSMARGYLYDGLTAPHIGKVVRVMSADDEERLADIDTDLAALRELVKAKRDERDEHVRASWRRAKPVAAGDLIELAEAEQRDIAERIAAANG